MCLFKPFQLICDGARLYTDKIHAMMERSNFYDDKEEQFDITERVCNVHFLVEKNSDKDTKQDGNGYLMQGNLGLHFNFALSASMVCGQILTWENFSFFKSFS